VSFNFPIVEHGVPPAGNPKLSD